jgi:hypothetical protein
MSRGEILRAPETPVQSEHDGKRRGRVKKGLGAAAVILTATSAAMGLGGCTSAADKVSENLSTAADNFEIERRIIFLNGVTDKIPLVIEGRCSIHSDNTDHQLEVTCKSGPNAYKKHFLGLSDNMSYVVEQLGTADADEYRTRVILRPETAVPDFELNTSSGN